LGAADAAGYTPGPAWGTTVEVEVTAVFEPLQRAHAQRVKAQR
jgi:hypothetical protein